MRAYSEKVVGSGRFGQSIEVFLSYQVAAIVIGIFCCILVLFGAVTGLGAVVVGVGGLSVVLLPNAKVSQALKDRQREVIDSLPEFVDLLTMSLAASMSIQPALKFTSQFIDGPVERTVTWLLETLNAGTMTEGEAFREAGVRLGTPEALAFFTALGHALTEGSRVIDTLNKQSGTMRIQAHNMRRADMKKIPVKLVVVFGMHFLPLLFVFVLIPFLSMASSL
jgi:tight adherence protein C